jgi:hypothetical protein
MSEFGERYRDAIERAIVKAANLGLVDSDEGHGGVPSYACEAIESVLLAATREIPCPAYGRTFGRWAQDHPDDCACRGSAVLRVLPTTETEK